MGLRPGEKEGEKGIGSDLTRKNPLKTTVVGRRSPFFTSSSAITSDFTNAALPSV